MKSKDAHAELVCISTNPSATVQIAVLKMSD